MEIYNILGEIQDTKDINIELISVQEKHLVYGKTNIKVAELLVFNAHENKLVLTPNKYEEIN